MPVVTIPKAEELRQRPAGHTVAQHHAAVRQAHSDRLDATQKLLQATDVEGRKLLASEQREFDNHEDEIRRLGVLLSQIEASPEARRVDRSALTLPGATLAADTRALAPEQRMADWVTARGQVDPNAEPLSMGRWLRGYVTGGWQGAEGERRALAEGALATGGAMVPTPLSVQIIDLARNVGAVFRAGAKTVPMDSSTLKFARVTGDPAPAWHTENQVITPSDAAFEAVTLTAHTLPVLTVLSRELVEDAPNVDTEVSNAFAQQIALTLDKAALYGSGTAPEPRGVLNTTNVTLQSMGTNGAAPTSFDFLVDAVGTLADSNFTATAIIDAPRTEREFGKLKDTTNQPLELPGYIENIPRYTTNQVPIAQTQGSASTASDAFVADWSNLFIGIRTGFSVQVLNERYADYGQIGLLGWLRADVLVARPKAFVVVRGIL